MSRVTLSDGRKVTLFELPPAGFDPLTASAEALRRYGFPSMPDLPRHRQRYQRVLRQVGSRLRMVTPELQVLPRHISHPRRPPLVPATEEGTGWSGGVVSPGLGTFRWIQGNWVVPDLCPVDDRSASFSAWIGIDGDGQRNDGDQVFQAGVFMTSIRRGSSIETTCKIFEEWFPDPPALIDNFVVRPGDYLSLVLCSRQGAGSTEGTAFFLNRTTGVGTAVSLDPPAGITLNGRCAEWIVEVLSDAGGIQLPFPDYGEVFFSDCEAVTTTGAVVFGGTGDNIRAFGVETLSVLSEGTLVSPTVVQCQYMGPLLG